MRGRSLGTPPSRRSHNDDIGTPAAEEPSFHLALAFEVDDTPLLEQERLTLLPVWRCDVSPYWTVAFWRRFPPAFPFWISSRNFRFGPPTIFSKHVACRAQSETFHSLAGRRVCTFRTQSASLASISERRCSCDTPTTELTPPYCAAFRAQTGRVEDTESVRAACSPSTPASACAGGIWPVD